MLVMMKKTCRPACPNSGCWAWASKVAAMKTVKSSTLPTMPTGHAQTRRRRPPTAEAKPNALPTISRQVIGWPGDGQVGVVEGREGAHAVLLA